jgi:hypothetical protein
MAAITAEAAMLREHPQRFAPGRHRRTRPPGPLQRRRNAIEGFWNGVAAVADAAHEVYYLDSLPPDWLGDAGP